MAKILRFRRRRRAKERQRGLFDPAEHVPIPDITLRPSRGTDAHPLPGVPTDAVPAPDLLREGEPAEQQRRRQRTRRRAALLCLAALFLGGFAAAIFAERGYLDVRQKKRELAAVREDLAEQELRVASLKKEVARLRNDPRAIERIARERLGFAKDGELVLVLSPPPDGSIDGGTGSDIVSRTHSQ